MFVLTVITLITLAEVALSYFSSGCASFPVTGSGADNRGAVASMDARCSKAGVDILELGGNAADAAITVEFCLGAIGMYSTGIGGGGVALVRDAQGHYDFLDFRETAPVASTENMFKGNVNASLWGGLASHRYRIHGCGLPSGGAVALNILSVLKGYDGVGDASNVNLTTHRLDEAMRFGYGLRTDLGDPDFDVGLQSYQQIMLSKDTASDIRSRISDDHTQPLSVYNPKGLEVIGTHGTSHLSVADSSGLAISLTSTINLPFGSHLMVPETGIILNNEMNDFSIPRDANMFGEKPSSVANYPQPDKRPLSSMNPILVDFAANGSFYAALGAQGSERIITSVVQTLWYLLDRKMGLFEALRAPRLHEQLSPNQTSYEWEYDNSTVAFMEERGHITAWLQDGSSVQAVRRLPNGTFEAAGESRQRDLGGFAV
ncbi:gamma-glutamyltransferase [Apiospora saccharicola]|uniref:Gamma-glutamyltransferase n=1 Tax=Apiospora saccharicola TaxID=335842 RepID=A0ABR1VK22_9PEZI